MSVEPEFEQPKEEVLEIKPEQTTHQKNTDGHLGPICNNCGGFGFTLTFGGQSNSTGCAKCDQTGVAVMSPAELQNAVVGLKTQIDKLSEIILNNLKQDV